MFWFAAIDFENYASLDTEGKKAVLNSLVLTVDDQHTGQFLCRLCRLVSKYKSNITDHIEAVHVGIELYQCDFCHLGFKSKKLMATHVSRKHKEEKQQPKSYSYRL